MWNLNQYIVWAACPRPDGKIDKIPIDTGSKYAINSQNSTNWLTREQATDLSKTHVTEIRKKDEVLTVTRLGIGFVFTPNDPYWFLDLDNCAAPDGSAWQPHALEICQSLAGAAIEVSQSGRGLHLVGCGPVPAERRIKSTCGRVELYTHGRFMAEGGRGWQGDPNSQHGPALARLCAQYLALNGSAPTVATVWTTEPVPEWSGPADDDELILKARASKSGNSVFGDGVTFDDLWVANGEALSRRWPDQNGREWGRNEADLSFFQRAAFWTGKNCERMLRIAWKSGLVRQKWHDRPDYLRRTILTAAGRQEAVLGGNRPSEPEPAESESGAEIRTGYQLMHIGAQREYFKGCVYILDRHRVWTPAGHLLKPEQFRAWYGGWAFTLDTENAKVTKSAWEAFTESQAVTQPRVETVDFDPLRPSGEIWTDTDTDNLSRINAFRPRYGRQAPGDVTPIQRHLELLFPNEADREIVTSYLAACLQLAGHKFQWCPVIQGVEGNGKTVLWRLLEYALGQEYCHLIDPRDILNPFNGWIELKLACGIEELWVHGKHEMAEALKTYITNERIPLQSKGLDQRTATNIANFLAFSNHKDAVLKTIRDRRYAMIYSGQQSLADLARDGMDAPYFRALYAFVRNSTGRAAAAHWLANYPVSVDVQGRAPRTTATDEAIRQSMGPAEQIVLEAVEMEEVGFQRGLIDLARCGEILRTHGRRMSPRAVGRMLQGIGYVRHPGLEASQGKLRVDGRLVKLYVLAGSEAAGEVGTDAIGRRYRGV